MCKFEVKIFTGRILNNKNICLNIYSSPCRASYERFYLLDPQLKMKPNFLEYFISGYKENVILC